jgi:hypothetical protein
VQNQSLKTTAGNQVKSGSPLTASRGGVSSCP